MPNVNDMKPSRFMKKGHIEGRPLILTIKDFTNENIAKENDTPEYKWLLHFDEFEKPMIMNATNLSLVADICGTPETDEMIGKQIEVYFDPNVMLGTERKGGIRLRAPTSEGQTPASVV